MVRAVTRMSLIQSLLHGLLVLGVDCESGRRPAAIRPEDLNFDGAIAGLGEIDEYDSSR
jgi:hypothetical protein